MTRKVIPLDQITRKFIWDCFDYDLPTGDLIWKRRPDYHFPSKVGAAVFNGRYSGRVAGKPSNGYKHVTVSGNPIPSHRVIYMMVHGRWPLMVDHINGKRDDNRITNLRECNKSTNAVNSKLPSTNKSGYKGVSLYKNGFWRACTKKDQKFIHIGLYKTQEEAFEAYKKKSSELFGGFSRPEFTTSAG